MTNSNVANGTVIGMVEYVDLLVEKGRMTQGGAKPLRTAIVKVFEAVDKDGWRVLKIDDIDLDDCIQRFANLTLGDYSQSSISVYKSRINRVLEWYKKFISPEHPGWMPMINSRIPSTGAPQKKTPTPVANTVQTQAAAKKSTEPKKTEVEMRDDAKLLTYPFPLSHGRVGQLSLPTDLEEDDARRLADFVNSLVVKTPKLLGQGGNHEEIRGER